MIKKLIVGLALAASLILTPSAAFATDVLNDGADNYAPNYRVVCITNATAGYTNATTTPSDITGASCVLPVAIGDYTKSIVRACYNADVTKATATTGSIGVYVNGSLQAASKRFISSGAGQGDVAGCFAIARSDGTAQTVKLQGVSGDTNTFTVSNAVFEVYTIQMLK